MISEKVLFVDDDKNLLSAVKRQFRNKLDLVAAPGGEDALTVIKYQGPFAVVISDMQMPYMNGIELLSHVRNMAPDTVRVMLTGNANLQTAIDSVNEGNIFRFLTKPCSPELLHKTIIAAIKQYRLQRTEHDLLNRTLKGAISLLTDVLSMVNPHAFSQASRIQRYVKQIVSALELEETWSYELAAMLSQLGRIAMPPEIIAKVASGSELSAEERAVFSEHPEIAKRLLDHIPRFEIVSAMIKEQSGSAELPKLTAKLSKEEKAVLGGHILKVVIAYDSQLIADKSVNQSIAFLRSCPQMYDPGIVAVLDSVCTDQHEVSIQQLPIARLKPGMIIDQNINSKTGVLYVAKGHEITQTIIYRLMGLEASGLWSGNIQVLINGD